MGKIEALLHMAQGSFSISTIVLRIFPLVWLVESGSVPVNNSNQPINYVTLQFLCVCF